MKHEGSSWGRVRLGKKEIIRGTLENNFIVAKKYKKSGSRKEIGTRGIFIVKQR